VNKTDYTSPSLRRDAIEMVTGVYGVDWLKYHMEFEEVLALQFIRKN